MRERELLLERHAVVHHPDVGRVGFTLHHLVTGLDDSQMRARPGGGNSIAWILWHIARVEDGCIAGTVMGVPALLDDIWTKRLGVDETGDGEGMSREQAAALGDTIDIEALHAYRTAVGKRTRELLAALADDAWQQPLSDDDIEDRVRRGRIPLEEAQHLRTFTRSSLLWWWSVEHTHYHLGQIAQLRS